MRIALEHRPAVIVVLMDSQYRPLNFSMSRLKLFQQIAEAIPEFPVLVSLYGNLKHVELSTLDIYNETLVKALNP